MGSKISRRLVLSGIVLGFTVSGGIAPALAKPTPIPVSQCGQVLNEPGNYVLTTDLPCPYGPNSIVDIVASNIDFNLNGHALEAGPGSHNAILLADGISNVSIHNGGVSGRSLPGIIVGNDSNISISSISFGQVGVAAFNELSLGGTNLRIAGNTFEGGNGVGSSIEGKVSNSVFSGNVFTGLGLTFLQNAISLEQSSGNMISGNTINIGSRFGGAGNGIVLDAGSSGNMIRDNMIFDVTDGSLPGTFGIDLELGATDNSIKSNTVTGGVYDGNGPPCVNSWKDNTFTFASGAVACIR